MKKDIEWLKKEIATEMIELEHNRNKKDGDLKYQTLRSVAQKIYQLDEPEVLSQEWIDEHSVAVAYDGIPDQTEIVYVDDLERLIVPKQEELESKIKVLIEAYKQEEDAYSNPENGWISGFIEDLKNLVEKEQKYYAKLKEIQPLEGEWLTNLSGPNYYALDTKGLMLGEFILDLVGIKTEASTHTLKDWERYGINDSNADFIKVEEME